MRKLLRIGVVSLAVLLGTLILSPVFSPYASWYVAVPGLHLTVNDKPAHGWLHRSRRGENLFVTETEASSATTYLVVIPPSGRFLNVKGCGKWTAPQFPVFPLSDVNPQCWTAPLEGDTNPRPNRPPRNLEISSEAVEFTADDGTRWKATW